MPKFYFTYGTDPEYPFRGGWTVIEAPTKEIAEGVFHAIHPPKKELHDGAFRVLNCADIYTEERFNRTRMPKIGNLKAYCHERYRLEGGAVNAKT